MIIFRPAAPEDVPFVRDSFWRGVIKSDNAAGATIPFLCRRFAELTESGWSVTIACDDETPGEIIGWILAKDRSRIAWVHVKGSVHYRRAGIGRRLVMNLLERAESRGDVFAPFVSPDGRKLIAALGLRLLFRPFLDAK